MAEVAAPEIELSVIGPAMNEAGNLTEYVERCLAAYDALGVRGEVIIIDDGSTDGTGAVLADLIARYPDVVRGIRHRRNFGLTQALRSGFQIARGRYIAWISTDLESHPDEDLPLFMEGFREGADVVAGYRRGREDGKNAASLVYNLVSNHLFGMHLHDMNWTKAFRRDCLGVLELRGDWHRFILMMFHTAGYKIVEKEMNWHPRRYGVSKFGLMRFPRALVDAVSIWFILTFSRKPMRLFGSAGLALFVLGLAVHAGLALYYLLADTQVRPLFWVALMFELAGVQFVLFGFVAELIERVRDEIDALRRRGGDDRSPGEFMVPPQERTQTREPETVR